jgi:hypothetical protein
MTLTFPLIRRALTGIVYLAIGTGLLQTPAAALDTESPPGQVSQDFAASVVSEVDPLPVAVAEEEPEETPPEETPPEETPPEDTLPDETPPEEEPIFPLFDWCPLPPPLPTSG